MSDVTEALRSLKVENNRLLIVLAGPNGAGKSTFHLHFLAAEGLPDGRGGSVFCLEDLPPEPFTSLC